MAHARGDEGIEDAKALLGAEGWGGTQLASSRGYPQDQEGGYRG